MFNEGKSLSPTHWTGPVCFLKGRGVEARPSPEGLPFSAPDRRAFVHEGGRAESLWHPSPWEQGQSGEPGWGDWEKGQAGCPEGSTQAATSRPASAFPPSFAGMNREQSPGELGLVWPQVPKPACTRCFSLQIPLREDLCSVAIWEWEKAHSFLSTASPH